MNDMSSKVYHVEGKNLEECKSKLTDKYGSNWVQCGWNRIILKKGILGFGQKEGVRLSYQVTSGFQDFSKAAVETSVHSGRISQAAALIDYHNQKQNSSIPKPGAFSNIPDGTFTALAQNANIAQKLDQITKLIGEGFSNMTVNTENAPEHQTITHIKELLSDNDFTKKYISDIVERIKKTFTVEELSDEDAVCRQVVYWIGEDINIGSDYYVKPPKVVVLCGPTGVGKTTTIAKLVAAIKLQAKKEEARQHPVPEIRIITTDITRVGAKEQMEHWASVMNLTVEKAEDPDELARFIKSNKDSADYIFIDTAGYSPKDVKNIANMAAILKGSDIGSQVFLTFTAGTKARDLEEILRNYEVLNYKSVIITKCDETSSFGGILSVLADKRKSVSYVTYGQDVFGTIERTSPARFLRTLAGFSLDDEFISKIEEKFGRKNSDTLI
ncbi:hypothetical protein [Treponema sp.]|uniref:flagellar biosynthesis protein FlhF n=1 Tax=Treponema sp. TaxID=166 RepID=UPI0025DFABEA|nr:hypothetical protein [Treponema sp.]MCR5217238.1 hypothetical protein [Treponema sp.]